MLRDRGYLAAVVERWNPYARIRQDLLGVLDLVAVREGETLGVLPLVVCCASAAESSILRIRAATLLRAAGWRIVVHGWRKNAARRWVLLEVDVS